MQCRSFETRTENLRVRKTLVLGSMIAFLASSITARAQSAYDMQAPPKVLSIYREFVKVGKEAAHDQHEAAWLKAMLKANLKTYGLTLTALTGEPEEWFMSGYNTFAEWEKDYRNFEENTALAKVMAKFGAKDGDYISNGRRIVAVFRPDLSYKPDFKLGEYRYFNVRTARYLLGSGPAEARKVLINAIEKGNLDWRWEAYEVQSGAPVNTYIFLIPMKSAAEWDGPPNEAFMAAVKEGHMEETEAKALNTCEYRLFSFNPRLSFVPESVAALDPAFWHPEAWPAKSQVTKNATTAAKQEAQPEK